MFKGSTSTAFFMLTFLFTLMLPSQSANLQPPLEGTICGTVQNEKGTPASLVMVEAIFLGAHSGMYDSAKTDIKGHYCMEHVRPGKYAMSADDQALGYPTLALLFYQPQLPEPLIVVSASAPHQIADWSIPYKAGFLRIYATDRTTGKAVPGVGMYLAVRGSEERRYMFGGWRDDTVLLPPNEDVYVTVKVKGYRPWPTGEQKGHLVTVRPGASLDLAAALDAATEP